MNLQNHLMEKKTAILKKWFEAVADTYPGDTAEFLKNKKARFTNPVGYNIAEGLEGLFDAMLHGVIPDTVSGFLDAIIRIRAIQDFQPSEALSFIFQLKKVIRKELGEVVRNRELADELTAFESVIDDLALFSFDIYMKCREKIYELKANEAKNMTFRLLQKARLIDEHQD
jgi:RsbT co-antagonist protein rsbRD N-terminal domain